MLKHERMLLNWTLKEQHFEFFEFPNSCYRQKDNKGIL